MKQWNLFKPYVTFSVFCLVISLNFNFMTQAKTSDYQFSQLNPFFDESLFGVSFDYNLGQELVLKTDLLTKEDYENITDPNPKENNVIALIGHEAYDIETALLSITHVKRTSEYPWYGSFEWETLLPFTKFIQQFTLSSEEEAITSYDFLGIALKLSGSGFNYDHYQLGYANIPQDFFDFLFDNFNASIMEGSNDFQKDSITQTSVFDPLASVEIFISEYLNELRIDIQYSNLIYLFQTSSVDLQELSGFNIAEHFVIAQFDRVTYSIIIRKYDHNNIVGVETISEITIGNVVNLIINEELPLDQSWDFSEQFKIEGIYKELFSINETFSWFKGSDIQKRLNSFDKASLSLFTGQSFGILNGTQSVANLQIKIDGMEVTKAQLEQEDQSINNEITIFHNDTGLLISPTKGRDFAIQKNSISNEISLIPVEIKTIALNQHVGFAGNKLFLQETSLLRDIIVDCLKHFIGTQEIIMLSADQIFTIGGLYLTNVQYIQDFKVALWSGMEFKLNLLQYATKSSSFTDIKDSYSRQITPNPVLPGIIALIILRIVNKTKKQKKLL